MKTVPNTATPMQLPMVRKNVAALVAVPRSRYSTAFCTARTSTCITMPSPTPSTNIYRLDAATPVSLSIRERRNRPTVKQPQPRIGKSLYRPVRLMI